MTIGYFGGSFDPPHRGHLRVAHAAREHFGLDEVLLAPTGRQPLKPDGAAAPFPDRLAMTELLCADQTGLRASSIDAPHADGSPNYTAVTLSRLRQDLAPGSRLFAILGADAFQGMPRWHDVDTLFTVAEWIIVSRPGFSLQLDPLPLSAAQRARVHPLRDLEDTTSATELRARLRAHGACDDVLPLSLCRYITAHHLYGA